MMTLKFDRYFTRKLIGCTNVHVFYKHMPEKRLLTEHFKNDFNVVHKNVILASCNETVSKAICETYDVQDEEQWLTVPRHLSDVLHMDLVVLMNTYSDVRTQEQCWEVAYFPTSPSTCCAAIT